MKKIPVVLLKMPVNNISNAVRIAKKNKAFVSGLESKFREKHPFRNQQEARTMRGETGEREYMQDFAKLDAERQTAKEAALQEIAAERGKAVAFIDEQVTLNGNDVIGDNAGDVELLRLGLISSPDQLTKILEKHDNRAFRALAEHYATERGWEGFSFIAKENSVREYTERAFDGLSAAVEIPGGLAEMQYTQAPEEYARMAGAFGLSEEFSASNGDAIARTVSEAAAE